MTLKQQLFVEAYLANGGNATQAARSAGYRGNDDVLRQMGAKLVANGHIASLISHRVADAAISTNEVLEILSAHARGDVDKLLDNDGLPSIRVARANGQTRLVKKWKTTRGPCGLESVEVQLHDSQNAAIQLGKYLGLFTDEAAIQLHAGEWATGFVADTIAVLRDYIHDDAQFRQAVEAIRSRLAARIDGRGGSGAGGGNQPSIDS